MTCIKRFFNLHLKKMIEKIKTLKNIQHIAHHHAYQRGMHKKFNNNILYIL